MARKKHEAEKKHALRKKEAPPVQDMPDETEHPALSEKKKPRVSKLLYRIIAALLIAVVLLIILENKDNLTPENIGNWIRTKAVGFGFGDGYPAELTGSTALVGNFGAADGNLYVVSDTALTTPRSPKRADATFCITPAARVIVWRRPPARRFPARATAVSRPASFAIPANLRWRCSPRTTPPSCAYITKTAACSINTALRIPTLRRWH